jgi:surface antigen
MEMAEERAAAERAAERQAIAEGQRRHYRRVAYQPVDYITPSNGRRHAIKPLNSYTDPVTKQTCNTYVEFSFAADGQSHNNGTHKACKGSDGTWHG